jgi:hypothetical protein
MNAKKITKTARENKKQDIKSALAKDAGAHLGDIVWSELSELDDQGFSRARIVTLLQAANLPTDVFQDEISAQGALGRARRDCDELRPGYSLQPLKKRERAFHLMRAQGVGTTAVRATLAVLSVVNDALVVDINHSDIDAEGHDVIAELRKRFAYHTDFISHRDVSILLVKMIRRALLGTPLKRQGHLYWVPAQSFDALRRFRGVVEQLGSSELSIMPVYDTHEAKAAAGRAMRNTFDDEIMNLMKRIEVFTKADSKTRAGTVTNRLEDIANLRVRVGVVSDILGAHRATLTAKLAEAEKAARLIIVDFDAPDAG